MSFTRARLFCLFVLLTASSSLIACESTTHNKGSDGGASDAGKPDAAASTAAACKKDSDCDDGLYCDGAETCSKGTCLAGKAVTCDDGIGCTVDQCSERTHQCASAAADRDGDGHGDATCKDKGGKTLGDDCDDTDPLRFPGNIEACDAANKDDDCDPKTFGEKDSDDDGFFDATCCNPASDAKGAKLNCGNDCDDLKASVNPKATEVCDLYDNDCDGKTDEGVAVKQYPDKDFDGHGQKGGGVKAVMKCAGSVGFALESNDCNDKDPEVFEGQFEICDGKDNNCKGGIDEIQQDAPWFLDSDADGFGDSASTPVFSCERIPGRVLSHNDCNDAAPAVNPAAAELCDGVDNDCSGKRDFQLDVNDFEDDDNDGVADAKCTGGKDCDDTDPTTGDGKEEVCDLHDNDCDGQIDEETAQTVWYLDKDGDGWGTDQGTALARCEPIPGRAASLGDCDDDVNSVHPGALETCNGQDDNCNLKLDEGADYQCSLSNSISFCKNGGCAVLNCFPGFDDCNNDPKDGCECVKTVVPGNACTFDAECDDGDYCDGKERCSGGFCYAGTPINCNASTSVLQGSFAISNSLDIQMLAGVETITGDLQIGAKGLVNLTGLEALKTIGGNLIVDGDLDDNQSNLTNESLTALVGSGLWNLISVGGQIKIEDNPSLVTIKLPSLVTAGSIIIQRNAALTTLDGFGSLAKVDGLVQIRDNTALAKISGMQVMTSVGELELSGNVLTELHFAGLTSVHGDLYLNGRQFADNTITKIVFAALTAVDGDVNVDNLAVLTQLSLPKLKTVSGLELSITNNPMLDDPDLHSFAKMDGLGDNNQESYPSFYLEYNDSLKNLKHVRVVDCPSTLCYAYVSYNPMLDNCDATDWLKSFTNFEEVEFYGNLQTSGDAGPLCPDGFY